MSNKVNCTFFENIKWKEQDSFECSKDTIYIWRVKIAAGISQTDNLLSLLNADELKRADRYYNEKDRKRFITSRGYLRILLSNYLKKKPSDIEFAITPEKKPYLKLPFNSLHYNISHSETDVLIAIAGSEVGIDVEKTDSSFDWENILDTSFSKDEIVWVKQSKMPKDSFYLLWTRKEALAKATGKGLLDDLTVYPSLEGIHNLKSSELFTSSWQVGSFKLDNCNIGSVACYPSITDHQFLNINPENF